MSKLQRAIDKGKKAAKARQADEQRIKAAAQSEEQRAFNKEVADWKKWLAPRIHKWIQNKVAVGEQAIDLNRYHLDGAPHKLSRALAEAIRSFAGIDATYREERVNMQDSSYPCWETVPSVVVTWRTGP